MWSIFDSRTPGADYITCGMSIYGVLEEVEVMVTVCGSVCVMCVCVCVCVVESEMVMKGREKVKPSSG